MIWITSCEKTNPNVKGLGLRRDNNMVGWLDLMADQPL